jgi:cellulose synthase/poly-beta-1,6-N-acetylglucosamine synthase-like glycosyltransferase
MHQWSDLAHEIIVVDSRSTDGTLEFIRTHLQHPNIRIIERDRGLYASWNEGIAATTGDWVYISTAGDTIEREQLLHLCELGERTEADVVISPPRFVNENGNTITSLNWPPHEIISKFGSSEPFILSKIATTCLAFVYCPSCILGSSASNLYRGDSLRKRPFPTDFRGAGDTVWLMRHSTTLRLCLTPKQGSEFCVHPKSEKLTPQESEAGIISFSKEKADLAVQLSEIDPRQSLSNLAKESALYVHVKLLHQRRRIAWREAKSSPLSFLTWMRLITTYVWARARLGHCRKDILSNLLTRRPDDPPHFQSVT